MLSLCKKWYKGKRLYPKDKNLIFRFTRNLLCLIVIVVMLLFHGYSLLQTDWNIATIHNLYSIIYNFNFWSSLTITLIICIGCGYWVYNYHIDYVKQLQHRQKLTRMILDNGWCDIEQVKKDSFFKDLASNKTVTRITSFPKCYYQMKNGIIYIKVEIVSGKAQESLLYLEKKLESLLYCELIEKELLDGYVEYQLLYDTIASRLFINEVYAEKGKLKLMKSLYWEYDELPHMLIAGGTGGGKTYFILTLIQALSKIGANLYILDPKNSDLADLETIMQNVYHKKENMLECLNQFYEDMMKRNEEMKTMKGYKTGKNYAYLGLTPYFLVFDEYVAFMEMIGRESLKVMSKLKQIVMLGRQSGFFLILACQRPDAKYLGDGIRDQFNFRVALGKMSELGYSMMYGDVQKDFFQKRIKGRGYVDTGGSVISEFYTPLVPKEYDFLEEIGKYHQIKKEQDCA